ncbi:MAG: DUF2815 family protein, partial [Methylomicrobium sp.]|nr:DUF2815 family protein [Methylomicrobium sp.]
AGEDTGKYTATFILDKKEHASQIDEIKNAIRDLIKTDLKGARLAPDKICLKNGEDSGRDELANAYTIKATTKRRPLVIDKDKTPIVESDNKLYPGCYVNAIITLWAQNNNWGRRVNAGLQGVQFVADGEPFGDAGVSVDEFDMFGETDAFDEDIPF